MRHSAIIVCVLTAFLAILSGCGGEGGDPVEAVPTGTFGVLYLPSLTRAWDSVNGFVAELSQTDPRLGEELKTALQELGKEATNGGKVEITSLQQLYDEAGLDVDRPLIVAYQGLMTPSFMVLASVADPDAFQSFTARLELPGEDKVVETYNGVEIRQRELYSAVSDGVLVMADNLAFLKAALDAQRDPAQRFFELENIRPVFEHYQDYAASLIIDFSTVAQLIKPLMDEFSPVPGMTDYLSRLKSFALALRVQPGAVTLAAGVYGEETPAVPAEVIPVPADVLAFFRKGGEGMTPDEKEALFSQLLDFLETMPDVAPVLESLGREQLLQALLSLDGRYGLFVQNAQWRPGITCVIGLKDSAYLLKYYDEKLRPGLEELLKGEADGAALVRTDAPGAVLDNIILGDEVGAHISPTIAFTDDYLIITSDREMVDKVRDVSSGLADGVETSADYQLMTQQLPGCELVGLAGLDKLCELLAMTPGSEIPEGVQLICKHFGLAGIGSRRDGPLSEAMFLLSSRDFQVGSFLVPTEIERGLAWWWWLVIGVGAALVIALVLLLILRRRPAA